MSGRRRSASERQARWWVASWTEIVYACPAGRARPRLPSMRLLRGVEPDLIFMLVPRFLGELEVRRRDVEAAGIRAWADNLVVGSSRQPPRWPHLPLTRDAVVLLDRDFNEFASPVVDARGRHLLSALIEGQTRGTDWHRFARTVLAFLALARLNNRQPPSNGLHAALMRAALADLRAAVDDKLRPAAELALNALGWPFPWSPFAPGG